MRRRGQLLHREQRVDDEVIDLTDRLAPYQNSAYRARPQAPAVEPEPPAPSFLEPDPLWLHASPLDRPLPEEPAEDPPEVLEPITAEPEGRAPVLPAVAPVLQEPERLGLVAAAVAPVVQEPEGPEPVAAPAAPASEELQDLDAVRAEPVPDEVEDLEAMGPATADPGPNTARPKQARNEPCACGSGRKHKRCCGQRPATSQPHRP